MSRLNAYVLRQLTGPFLFFVLVFTGVIWLSQSLRVIDTVVNNGQSATVFLEFTLLLLPRVMAMVLPVAALAATLYAVNRLVTDSEVVVMFAAGRSGAALLAPVAVFCTGLLALCLAITLWVVPNTQSMLRDRVSEIRGDVAAAFIREGAFVRPSQGVSVYVRAMGRPGELLNVFIHDSRDPEQIATYTAERAVLLPEEAGTRLVMFDGIAQIASESAPESLSVLRFDQLGYDLGQLTGDGGARVRKPSEMFVTELLTMTEEDAKRAFRPLGEFRAEAHEAISAPLYALALPLLAVAIVVSAGFRRHGFNGRVVAAVGLAVTLRVLGLAAKNATASDAALWPLMYAPPLAGIGAALWLLTPWALAPRRRRIRIRGGQEGLP